MSDGTCRFNDCRIRLNQRQVFCRGHWRLISSATRSRIVKYRRIGPKEALHQAIHDGIEEIKTEERRRSHIGLSNVI